MYPPLKTFSVFLLAFLLGLRHGIDWDHIAAITDITGSAHEKRKSFILGFFYIVGHATVIITLGLAAVTIGVKLPGWVDKVMEPFVGATLIILGLWLFYSILKHGKEFRLKSRWMLLFAAVHKLVHWFDERLGHKHIHDKINYPEQYGHHTAFTVGLIHGIGAETPTQVLLFVAAAGARGSLIGSLLVFTFVAGLITSNTFISVVSITGYKAAQKNSVICVILGLVTAIFSLGVGTLFLLSKSAFLPAIFGG